MLTAVRGFARGRVVALFGCGGDRDRTKRPKMGAIAARLADFVVVTSDNPRTEVPGDIIRDILAGMEDTETPYMDTRSRVRTGRRPSAGHGPRPAGGCDRPGGKGHETYQEVNHQKRHMDEREIVAEHIAACQQK